MSDCLEIVICGSCKWQGVSDKLNRYKENKTEDLPGRFMRQFTDIKEFCPNCGSIEIGISDVGKGVI